MRQPPIVQKRRLRTAALRRLLFIHYGMKLYFISSSVRRRISGAAFSRSFFSMQL